VTASGSPITFWFRTKAAALARVRSWVGAPAFQYARMTNREDGGMTVQIVTTDSRP